MKNVLIVDNDPIMLQTLTGLLKGQGGMFTILSAKNGRQALEIVAEQPVDIVITGLRMPEIDGFELLTRMAEHHPAIRVIVMTNNASPMFRAKIKQMNTAVHFDQAVDLNLLTKRIFTELQIDYGGQVRGINLSSFLQMIELEEHTCTLQISAKNKTGFLYLSHGRLIDAQYDQLSGKAAAYQILTWENVVIDLDYSSFDRRPQITTPLMGLLMESGRLLDEKKSRQTNKRQHDRYDCLVAVDYDISDWTYQCFLRDISLGGAYIETEQAIAVGQKIILTLSVPEMRNCAINGQVVRRDKKGIGIRFDALSLQQKQVIALLTRGGEGIPPKPDELSVIPT